MSNFRTATIDRFLDDVTQRGDTDPVRHMRLAALRRSRSLLGADLLASWRARAAEYPDRLVTAMIEQALDPQVLTGWAARYALASRGDGLALCDLLARVGHAIVAAVLALNRVYLPHRQLKWQRDLVSGLSVAPVQFPERLRLLAARPATEALRVAEALLADTVSLATAHTDADISAFRAGLSERRRGVYPPPGPEFRRRRRGSPPVMTGMSVIEATARRLGGRDRVGTLAAASLGFSVVQLDVFVVNVAVRQIGAALGGGTSGLQWVVGVYTLMFAALILTAGTMGDRFGSRRMLIAGFAVFMAASLGCGLAPDMGVLIAARAIQGAGAALLGACSLALINHAFTGQAERDRAVAVWAAGAAVALSAGPIVGGLLIAAVGWRAIFFINLPLGAAGLWLARRYAPETEPAWRRFDAGGQLTAVVALGALAWALIEGGATGFASEPVVAGFAVAAASLAGFLVIEIRHEDPMLPLALFCRRAFAAPAFLGLLVNVAFYGLIFVFSLLLQKQDGYSALGAGLAFLPMTAAVLVANLASGRLVALVGRRTAILTGLAGMAAGCAGLLPAGPGADFATIVGQQVLLGAGIGLLVPPMTSTLMGCVDRSRSGIASGTLNALRQAGSVLGVAVFGSLIAAKGHFSGGFRDALLISIIVIAAGALLALAIAPASPGTDGEKAYG